MFLDVLVSSWLPINSALSLFKSILKTSLLPIRILAYSLFSPHPRCTYSLILSSLPSARDTAKDQATIIHNPMDQYKFFGKTYKLPFSLEEPLKKAKKVISTIHHIGSSSIAKFMSTTSNQINSLNISLPDTSKEHDKSLEANPAEIPSLIPPHHTAPQQISASTQTTTTPITSQTASRLHISHIQNCPFMTTSALVNTYLIRSASCLASGDNRDALANADLALGCAVDASGHEDPRVQQCFYKPISKAQFYRGKALMRMQRWEEASSAFTRAAGIWDWCGEGRKLKDECESMIKRGGYSGSGPKRCRWEAGQGW
ncbi:hypothetical protein F5884DRAFT_63674 [Xylogone sp. PMI_703]|nr:hypothetical protein F5884DRAFT_63674 [Xylogone sp. PMI_703]